MIEWCKEHWRLFVWIGSGVVALSIIAQCVYPANRLVPFTTIDGIAMGHWQKQDAAWQLDAKYRSVTTSFYFGNNTKPHTTVPLSDFGMTARNGGRVAAFQYPWYFRLIPSSIFWYHAIAGDKGPDYKHDNKQQTGFIDAVVGKNCHVAPINASLKAEDTALKVVPAVPGGECKTEDVAQKIATFHPRLSHETTIRIPVTEKPAKVTDTVAADVASMITSQVGKGVIVKAEGRSVTIPAKDIYSWLVFSTKDDALTATIDAAKAKPFLDKNIAPLVARQAGTTTITTRDFMEVARTEGVRGQALDNKKTAESITNFINNDEPAVAQVVTTSPKVTYKRSYSSSNTGLSALMKNYADSHPGTYGVAMYELSGQRRRAEYNGSKSFVTASTYKLYVAYSTIKRVDEGKWHWSDANIAGGRNRSQCFDDMIVQSDNACAEALLKAVGYTTITNEVHALGLNNTSFISDNTPHSTANDEALFLAQLETDQLPISASGRSKLLAAMKRQVYRQGIPAGVTGAVADKVGFLWGLLHDAAIVYSPKGTYVLVILTDNSSWGAIADLAKQIEALR